MKTKQIVLTAVFLALCIIFQSMKGFSVYLTGTAVNALLALAVLDIGLGGGIFLAVMTPLIAYLMGATPVMQMIPLMVPVVMLGNSALVLCIEALRKRGLILSMAVGTVLKAAVLWLSVWYAVLPFFGAAVPEQMKAAVRVTFSVTQLITAAAGCVIAYIVHSRLKHK